MSDALRAAAHRTTPLLFLSCLLIFAVAGCGGTSNNLKLGLKNPSPKAAPAREAAEAHTGESATDEFVVDPLATTESAPTAAPSPAKSKASVKNVLNTAFSQVGNPYRRGGSKPETGFDCSGFVKWVYGQYGIGLPRSSGDMMGTGTSVARKELKPGDLVFFGRKQRITHVGIYTGDNKYIHSPSTGKRIQESSLDDRARGEYYAGARRVLKPGSSWTEEAGRQMAMAKATAPLTIETPVEVKPAELPEPAVTVVEADSLDQQPTLMGAIEMSDQTDQPVLFAEAEPSDQVAAVVAETKKSGKTTIQLAEAKKPGKTTIQLTGDKKTAPAAAKTAEAKKPEQAAAKTAEAKKPDQAAAKTAQAKKPDQAAAKTAQAKKSAGKKTQQHKVASGDTLYDLARKYGVTTDALAKANNLDGKKVAMLKLGQTLVVPPKEVN